MNSNDYEKDFNNYRGGVNKEEVNNQMQVGPNQIGVGASVEGQAQNPLAPKKKNRTLQFYKFLFYSMKTEIKIHEFYDLIRFSNQSEISLWILSLVLYFNSPHDFTNVFVWIHIIHIIRGVIGFLILIKLPRSYTVVESMKNIPEKEMETKLFNDIARSVIKRDVVEPLERMKGWLIVYFILTFVNFIFDVIDFLYILANIDKENTRENFKIIMLSYLIIAFIYLAIDFAYVFWTASLKYYYPDSYMAPINLAFSGALEKLKLRFRIGKKETDIRKEAIVQNLENKNNLNEIGGNNLNPDHIEIDMGENDKSGNHKIAYDQPDQQHEENLDH